jgi:hypothetical protein
VPTPLNVIQLAWAQGKRYWTVERDWSRVIFPDECKIIVGENNRVFVWRKPGEYIADILLKKWVTVVKI